MLKSGLMAVGTVTMIVGAALLFLGSGVSVTPYSFMGIGLVALIVGFVLPY